MNLLVQTEKFEPRDEMRCLVSGQSGWNQFTELLEALTTGSCLEKVPASGHHVPYPDAHLSAQSFPPISM